MLLLGRRVERDDLGHGRAVATELGVDEGREAVAVRNLCSRRPVRPAVARALCRWRTVDDEEKDAA